MIFSITFWICFRALSRLVAASLICEAVPMAPKIDEIAIAMTAIAIMTSSSEKPAWEGREWLMPPLLHAACRYVRNDFAMIRLRAVPGCPDVGPIGPVIAPTALFPGYGTQGRYPTPTRTVNPARERPIPS